MFAVCLHALVSQSRATLKFRLRVCRSVIISVSININHFTPKMFLDERLWAAPPRERTNQANWSIISFEPASSPRREREKERSQRSINNSVWRFIFNSTSRLLLTPLHHTVWHLYSGLPKAQLTKYDGLAAPSQASESLLFPNSARGFATARLSSPSKHGRNVCARPKPVESVRTASIFAHYCNFHFDDEFSETCSCQRACPATTQLFNISITVSVMRHALLRAWGLAKRSRVMQKVELRQMSFCASQERAAGCDKHVFSAELRVKLRRSEEEAVTLC